MTAFTGLFGRPPDARWRAPGRVNLIGEHTDYNDGFVLPIAIDRTVTAHVARRTDGMLRATTSQQPGTLTESPVAGLSPGSVAGWAGYVAGVVWALGQAGHQLPGMDVYVDGDVPTGAGLSSSAALECAVAAALDDAFALGHSRTELAQFAHHAETRYVGVPCGIMDQNASMLCQADHALFLDARHLQSRQVPFLLTSSGVELLVIDTRVRHDLADGQYAERRAECEQAASLLGVPALRDLAAASLPAVRAALPSRQLHMRVEHVVTENARVLAAVELLDAGADPRELGPLLTASHNSLRDHHQVSCRESDLAVASALTAGAHGARMTGGGFGGSVIALVDHALGPSIRAAITHTFTEHGLTRPHIFAVTASVGACRITG